MDIQTLIDSMMDSFGITQGKLESIDHDIYSLVVKHCDLETQLQLRVISRGFRSLVKEVNPDLFKQLLIVEDGPYKHFFDNIINDSISEIHALLMPLTNNFAIIPCHTFKRFHILLSKHIEAESEIDTSNFNVYLSMLAYAFLAGNKEFILRVWTKPLTFDLGTLLEFCAYTGNIECYKLLLEQYPLPGKLNNVDTEVWLSYQLTQAEHISSLFRLLLIAERFDLCDAILAQHGNGLIARIGNCISSQRVYDYIIKHKPDAEFSDIILCAIPDIRADLLIGKDLDSDCINLLFENRRFDLLEGRTLKLNKCTTVGQALYFGHKPFRNIHQITNRNLLTQALALYAERIDWKQLFSIVMSADSASPLLFKEFHKRNMFADQWENDIIGTQLFK